MRASSWLCSRASGCICLRITRRIKYIRIYVYSCIYVCIYIHIQELHCKMPSEVHPRLVGAILRSCAHLEKQLGVLRRLGRIVDMGMLKFRGFASALLS